MSRRALPLLCCAVAFVACPKKPPVEPEPPVKRCTVDLDASRLFSSVGSGASAKVIESTSELIGGEMAQGAVGDYLLENDKVRVVVQRPLRAIGPLPYGGVIIDADLKRPASETGRDQLGKVGLVYQFGRTINATNVEVLKDGSSGGYAVIAATGDDALNDFINLPNVIGDLVPGVQLVKSPDEPVSLYATTYYVLSPGESRVRMLTAFCNTSSDNVVMAVGDLVDQGGSTDFFNPAGCTNGMGSPTCTVDPSPWFGFQGDAVAYAVRGFTFGNPAVAETQNALLSVTGVVGTIAGGKDQSGLLAWLDPAATSRPGAFGILAQDQRSYVRDLHIGKDLADISSQFLALDGATKARLDITLSDSGGAPVREGRVAVISAADDAQKTLVITDDDGKGRVDLPPGNYRLFAGRPGAAIAAPTVATVPSTGQVSAALTLGPSRTLKVHVEDSAGGGLPSKVVVVCPAGSCQFETEAYRHFFDVDSLPSNVAAMAFAGADGVATVPLPPGNYEVFVSHGPEYSAWPDTFPSRGERVDLNAGDVTLSATLVKVVDTAGWVSADLHVHAVNSADSSLPNRLRVLSFAAEGTDVLVSTDHDVLTDYAPFVAELNLQAHVSTMVGCEVTPFDFGHHNAFPLQRDDSSPNGGAFDWAGGDGPTLRPEQLYSGLKSQYPGAVVQMNHPRSGAMNLLKVDTATLATHADPAKFRMAPAPDATPNDTKLLSDNFDAIEVMTGAGFNNASMNDWMTLLSRGSVKSATAVTDSHRAYAATVGYGRTWVKTGTDAPADFNQSVFADAVRAHQVVGGNGPFIRFTAQRLSSADAPLGAPVEVGGTAAVTPASGEKLELTVDVQAPEWMRFTSIELYTHTAGREAVNGVANADWPTSRILQSKVINPSAIALEPVPGSVNARRVHVTERFTVSPTADTWYVAFVRSSNAGSPLFPLALNGVSCASGTCTTSPRYPFAYTNAILVDADGSGRYDDYPLTGQPLSAPLPVVPPPMRKVPTAAEVDAALRQLLYGEAH